jgi:hypothetical protein
MNTIAHRMKAFRCTLVRHSDGRRITYVGPVDQTPTGWSIVKRAPLMRKVAA